MIARILPRPYFFAYRWACMHHGLSTQIPRIVPVALVRPKRPVEFHFTRFEFIELAKSRMFGYLETTLAGERINVSDLERTTLDALDQPDLVGGVEIGASAVFHAARRWDQGRLLDYLRRFNDSALARRLGYLCGVLKVHLGLELSAYLAAQTGRIPAYLGTPRRWGKEGPLDERWSLRINVPKDELLGEVYIG